jgi:hypothetical protein
MVLLLNFQSDDLLEVYRIANCCVNPNSNNLIDIDGVHGLLPLLIKVVIYPRSGEGNDSQQFIICTKKNPLLIHSFPPEIILLKFHEFKHQ